MDQCDRYPVGQLQVCSRVLVASRKDSVTGRQIHDESDVDCGPERTSHVEVGVLRDDHRGPAARPEDLRLPVSGGVGREVETASYGVQSRDQHIKVHVRGDRVGGRGEGCGLRPPYRNVG